MIQPIQLQLANGLPAACYVQQLTAQARPQMFHIHYNYSITVLRNINIRQVDYVILIGEVDYVILIADWSLSTVHNLNQLGPAGHGER